MAHVIFCDGACSGNPGPGGWGSIVATESGIVAELGGAAAGTTNNRMELTAAIEALREIAEIPGAVQAYTDSTYVIQGITGWIFGWRKKGWKTQTGDPVVNQDLWEALAAETEGRVRRHGKESAVTWTAVPGHAGICGNDRCDEIAVAFSLGEDVDLYQGPRNSYGVDLTQLTPDEKLVAAKKAKKKSKAPKTGYYLSYVGRTVERHDTWAACEARVKGVAGAKFKKVADEAGEAEVLKAWGIKK